MNKKTFNAFRIFFALIISTVVASSVVRGNYILPVIIAATAMYAVYAMKKRVSDVLADERDYQIAGKAARWAVCAYTSFAAIASIIFMSMRAQNPQFEIAGSVLAYSACALMIVQSLLFKIFSRKNA